MISIFYNKYKTWFWIIVSFLFITGGISNLFIGAGYEVVLNFIIGIVCLIVAISIFVKQRKDKK